MIQDTTQKIILIKQRMQDAQDRQKSYADRKRKPMEFEIRDRVMLKVSHWKGVVRFIKWGKLNPRYIGPFKVLSKVGKVAYRLELPQELSRVHHTYWIKSYKLRPLKGPITVTITTMTIINDEDDGDDESVGGVEVATREERLWWWRRVTVGMVMMCGGSVVGCGMGWCGGWWWCRRLLAGKMVGAGGEAPENERKRESSSTRFRLSGKAEKFCKAKPDEIAIRRAKLLAKIEAINKEAEEPEKQKKTKNQSKLASPFKDNEDNAEKNTEKDANESADAIAKAKKDEEAATKRSNLIVRLKAHSKELYKAKKQIHVEETKDREDSEDLHKEIEGENNEDKIREATESENEEIIDEKTKRIKKYRKKKETATTKGTKTRNIEEEEDMESNEKTKAFDSKEKKSRNNASEDEDDAESKSEQELKMTRKRKNDGAEEDTKPRKKVTLQKGSVKATRQKVHDILGIPMENTKLQDLEQRDANDPFIVEWEAQYSHLKKPTPPAIALQILSITEEDFMFKMNFITLYRSTMETLENGGRVPTKVLKCIKERDDIA
uniref:Reverse transcriptase domain-containing protein n=1 Tax=Tanacetum cinerariifolium TaxID=118510 RepID=A0A6L2LPI4_TANCI|nr:reverse transcriptase domain-containing protein [Tanacetum cinerariifolium]